MPVAIGNELKLENNKVNAYYDNLFRKLNVAKAWTNTTITESGGTVSVLVGDGDISTNIECGYNDWICCNYSTYCIINGKIYKMNNGALNQVGSKSDWIDIAGNGDSYTTSVLAIDSSHDLYYITGITSSGSYSSITEKGAGINWTMVEGSGTYAIGVGDDKLYYISYGSISLISEMTGWEKIIYSYGYGVGLNNGYVYMITNNNITLLSTNNNFIDISGGISRDNYGNLAVYALNTNGELYWIDNLQLVKSNFNKGVIKQISNGYSDEGDGSVITEDNKLYYQYSTASPTTSWYE